MTERERLIELLKGGLMKHIGKSCNLAENLADHLLSNGVIVPPCKVGDTVYYIDTCVTAEDFGKKFVAFSKVKRISVDNKFVILEDHTAILWEYVFLTKEEAEKALAERGKG